jgi:hypothetical protein
MTTAIEKVHCVHFCDMAPELLRGLPVIVQRVLNAEGLEFTLGHAYRAKLITEHQVKNGRG